MEITGSSGELIDRLIQIIDDDPAGTEGWWFNLSQHLVMEIGGLSEYEPDTEREYAPGTIGALRRAEAKVVPRPEWFALIAKRLRWFVDRGMVEDFLVTAVRNSLDSILAGFADTSVGAENRANARAHFQRFLDEPGGLEEYRALMRDQHHDDEANTLSDDDLRARLQRFIDTMRPIDADDAAQHWTALDAFRTRVGDALSDEDIDAWTLRHVLPND